MDLINTSVTRTYAMPVTVRSNQFNEAICKEFSHLKINAFFKDKDNERKENKESEHKNTANSEVHQNTEVANEKKFKLHLEVESLEPLSEATLKKISLFVEKEEQRIDGHVKDKEKQHETYLADKLGFYNEKMLLNPINDDLGIFRKEILETHAKIVHPKEDDLYDGMNEKNVNKSIEKLKKQFSMYTTLNKEYVSLYHLEESAKIYHNIDSVKNNHFGPSVLNHLEKEFEKLHVNLRDEFNTDLKSIPFDDGFQNRL